MPQSLGWASNGNFASVVLACCAGGEPAFERQTTQGQSCLAPDNPNAPDRRETPSVRQLARRRKTRCATVAQLKQVAA
jgi:hypothetical protein